MPLRSGTHLCAFARSCVWIGFGSVCCSDTRNATAVPGLCSLGWRACWVVVICGLGYHLLVLPRRPLMGGEGPHLGVVCWCVSALVQTVSFGSRCYA